MENGPLSTSRAGAMIGARIDPTRGTCMPTGSSLPHRLQDNDIVELHKDPGTVRKIRPEGATVVVTCGTTRLGPPRGTVTNISAVSTFSLCARLPRP
jgi:hypothetical protein